MSKSTKRRRGGKATRPHPDFPLFKHATGRWCKKVRGKHHYFGKVADDPDGQKALAEWLRVKDFLLAGKEPPPTAGDGPTLAKLCNEFLHVKREMVDTGELVHRTWLDYKNLCELLVQCFGRDCPVANLTPQDFERLRRFFSRNNGPFRLAKLIVMTRTLLRWAWESGRLKEPVRTGPTFRPPSKATFRKERAKAGPRLFTPDEIHRLLDAADQPLRAMILLAANTGIGPGDIGRMELRHIQALPDGWGLMDYPRHKSGASRRAFLWPETRQAIEEAIARRPKPAEPSLANRVFLTRLGRSWFKENSTASPLSAEFRKLRRKAGIERENAAFYDLRRGFQTVGEECGDLVAVQVIMGHTPASGDMSAIYRQRVSDERLRRVAEHVRQWLFGDQTG